MRAMALQFILPAQTGHGTVETRVAETRRWLANLPVLNAAESSHLLFNALTALNRRLLDDSTRLQLLELYRRAVRDVCAEQQKRYLGLPLPLPQDGKLVAERVRQFQVEMAYGYKRIVVGRDHEEKNNAPDRSELALPIQRAIRYLTEVLAKSYELYAPGPEGTWREIHQLYRYAEIEGITDVPVADELNSAVPHSSVAHVYNQALLLDFSDPYHLPARMLQKISEYLDAYAPMAQLTMAIAALRPNCQFLVNLVNDRAGVANIEGTPITTEAQYRLLTTVELARVMHQQLVALQSGQQPPADALGREFYANRGHEMLMRLITSWGVNPKRHFPRTEKKDTKLEVACGINAINYYANNAVPFNLSTTEVGPQPARTQISTSGARPVEMPASVRNTGAPWDLLEESAGGFSIGKVVIKDERINVGDLIATRTVGQNAPWGIAVVRWARSSGPDDIEIGAQRLAPAAEPMAVMAADSAGSEFKMALRLPEMKPLQQPETLIAPRGTFKPGRALLLDNSYRTYQIQPTKLINITGSFEQFQFTYLK